MDVLVGQYLNGLEFGKLQEFNSMAVFPVFVKTESKLDYMTLNEAIKGDLLEIKELDDAGAVPELMVTNSADIPVLILDGEELVGAKQNRVVNTTILLKENSKTIIPVSCVEQGRWSYNSDKFLDSDRIASYNIRNVKSASVKKSVERSGSFKSDQGAVWDEVHKLQDNMKVHSPTIAMSDVYDAKVNDLEKYIEAIEHVEGQNGLLILVNGKIIGFDVLSSSSAYKNIHKKLIKSYAIDAMTKNQEESTETQIRPEYAEAFISNILGSNETKNRSVGYGLDYRFATDSYIGYSLVYQDEVIHSSFFKSLEFNDEDIGDMARYRTRANMRQ
jgi:hypothetical protein